ncbi:MAG: DNA-packaging protein [Acidiferrobacterales bacterium]|nr:DNA-packaging protein [Acidiferrobacterales bacterium]
MASQIGRPSKYNDELQAKADSYLMSLQDLGHVVPSRAGLCCFLGISRSTSHEWEKTYPDFSDTLSNIEVMQEHLALNGGLSNALNSTIVKLVLANHGYSEKSAIDHQSSDGSMTPRGLNDFYAQFDGEGDVE